MTLHSHVGDPEAQLTPDPLLSLTHTPGGHAASAAARRVGTPAGGGRPARARQSPPAARG